MRTPEATFDAAFEAWCDCGAPGDKLRKEAVVDHLTDQLAMLSDVERLRAFSAFHDMSLHAPSITSTTAFIAILCPMKAGSAALVSAAVDSVRALQELDGRQPGESDDTTSESADTTDEDADDLCTICYDKPRGVRFRPCHHSIMCDTCALRLLAQSKERRLLCPSCSKPVEKIEATSCEPLKPVRMKTYDPEERQGADGFDLQDYIKLHSTGEESDRGGVRAPFDHADAARAAANAWGRTPTLTTAVADNDLERARELRAAGASVTEVDEDGDLPLQIACSHGFLAMSRWLLNEGAELDAPDPEGDTALHVAVGEGHTAVVRMLLDEGAAIDLLNDDGDTPFLLACARGVL